MKKFFLGLLMTVLLAVGASATVICKTVAPPTRWYKFVTVIGTTTFTDYVKIKTIDSCGKVTAVNEYGTELIGYRRLLPGTNTWAYDLHLVKACYYIDSFDFLVKICNNPGNFWHWGHFKCHTVRPDTGEIIPMCNPSPCYDQLCSTRHMTYFSELPNGVNPPASAETEAWHQNRKYYAE